MDNNIASHTIPTITEFVLGKCEWFTALRTSQPIIHGRPPIFSPPHEADGVEPFSWQSPGYQARSPCLQPFVMAGCLGILNVSGVSGIHSHLCFSIFQHLAIPYILSPVSHDGSPEFGLFEIPTPIHHFPHRFLYSSTNLLITSS